MASAVKLPPLRVMGFDPGSTTFGVCVMDINRNTKRSSVTHVETIDASKLFKRSANKAFICCRGERDLRVGLIRDNLYKLMLKWKPEVIVAEAPFLNRYQVSAFEALIEVRAMIRAVVWDYDQTIKVVFVDPIRVKNYIGVSHIKTTKDDMNVAVHAYYDSRQKKNALTDADEHSIDAVAVCHFYYRSKILGDVIESTKKKKKRGKNAGKRTTEGDTGPVSGRSSSRKRRSRNGRSTSRGRTAPDNNGAGTKRETESCSTALPGSAP